MAILEVSCCLAQVGRVSGIGASPVVIDGERLFVVVSCCLMPRCPPHAAGQWYVGPVGAAGPLFLVLL